MTLLLAALALAPASINVSLAPEAGTIHAGDLWKAKFRYNNPTAAALTVLPMHVTEHAVHKAPRTYMEVRRYGSELWHRLGSAPGCGNTNPITRSEFQILQSRESAEREAFFPWTELTVGKDFLKAGDYEVRATYDTTGAIDEWIGGPIPEPQHSQRREEIRALFDGTPHGTFVTAPVRIQVR